MSGYDDIVSTGPVSPIRMDPPIVLPAWTVGQLVLHRLSTAAPTSLAVVTAKLNDYNYAIASIYQPYNQFDQPSIYEVADLVDPNCSGVFVNNGVNFVMSDQTPFVSSDPQETFLIASILLDRRMTNALIRTCCGGFLTADQVKMIQQWLRLKRGGQYAQAHLMSVVDRADQYVDNNDKIADQIIERNTFRSSMYSALHIISGGAV